MTTNVDVSASPSRQTRAMSRRNGGLEYEKPVWSTRQSPSKRVMGLEIRALPTEDREAQRERPQEESNREERWQEEEGYYDHGSDECLTRLSPSPSGRVEAGIQAVERRVERATQAGSHLLTHDGRQTDERTFERNVTGLDPTSSAKETVKKTSKTERAKSPVKEGPPARAPSPTKSTVTVPRPFSFTERRRVSPTKSMLPPEKSVPLRKVAPERRPSSPTKARMMPPPTQLSKAREVERSGMSTYLSRAPESGNVRTPSLQKTQTLRPVVNTGAASERPPISRGATTSSKGATPSSHALSSRALPSRQPVSLPTSASGVRRSPLYTRTTSGKAQRGHFQISDSEEDDEGAGAVPHDENKNVTSPSGSMQAPERRSTFLSEPREEQESQQNVSARAAAAAKSDAAPTASPPALSEETTNALASLEATLARLKSRSAKIKEQRALEQGERAISAAALAAVGHRRSPSKSPEVSPRKIRSLSPSKEMKEQRRQRSSDDDAEEHRHGSAVSFLDRVRAAQAKGARAAHPTAESSAMNVLSRPKDPSALPDQGRTGNRAPRVPLAETHRSTVSRIPSDGQVPQEPTAADVDEENRQRKKEEKKARRRSSLYTYIPSTKCPDDSLTTASGESDESLVASGRGGMIPSAIRASRGDTSSVGDSETRQSSSRRFLRGLVILVDVREQDGDDASSTWVEMLRSMGAKVMVRASERRLSHIVFKSGKPATLHHFRAQPDPKPLVVGVNWVLRCAEEGRKVNEEDYLVEVGKQAVFLKTRRKSSMAPKMAPGGSESPPATTETILKERRRSLHAPPVPSPLANRAWNMDSSTDSTAVLQDSASATTATTATAI